MYIEVALAIICLFFAILSVLSKGFGKIIVNQFLMSLSLSAIFAYLGAPVLAIVQILLSLFSLLAYFVFGIKMVNLSLSNGKSSHVVCKAVACLFVVAFAGGLGFFLLGQDMQVATVSDLVDIGKLSIISNEYWPMILVLTILANLMLIASFFITDSEEA